MMNTVGYVDELDCVDPLLGYSRKNSFVWYKKERKESCKIIVMGDSGSDNNRGNLECWASFLQKILGDNYYIGNGAIAGYNSAQNLLKLIRDVIPQKPDIVIHVGGSTDINDASRFRNYNLIGKWQKRMWDSFMDKGYSFPDSLDMRDIHSIQLGDRTDISDVEEFILNTSLMNAICNTVGIVFYSILEPMVSLEGYVIDTALKLFFLCCGNVECIFSEQGRFIRQVQSRSNHSYDIDVYPYFRGTTEMFYDPVHLTEKGNYKLAEAVADVILKRNLL